MVVIVTSLSTVVTIMLKRTGTKQRSDDRTTNMSRLIIVIVIVPISSHT